MASDDSPASCFRDSPNEFFTAPPPTRISEGVTFRQTGSDSAFAMPSDCRLYAQYPVILMRFPALLAFTFSRVTSPHLSAVASLE